MTIADLKRSVLKANLELVERGLVFDTFGNASGLERDLALVVIKPSGVPYGEFSCRGHGGGRARLRRAPRGTQAVL